MGCPGKSRSGCRDVVMRVSVVTRFPKLSLVKPSGSDEPSAAGSGLTFGMPRTAGKKNRSVSSSLTRWGRNSER